MSIFMKSCLVASSILLASNLAFGEEVEVSNAAPVAAEEAVANTEADPSVKEVKKAIKHKKHKKRKKHKKHQEETSNVEQSNVSTDVPADSAAETTEAK
jgi:hypothetical protein